MKKFTFLLALFMIALVASPQNKNDLQIKIQQASKKSSKLSQKTALLARLHALNSASNLKSAAAKLKLDSTVTLMFNPETSIWLNDYKDEFFYDPELKNTSWIEKDWNPNSKSWNPAMKAELGYDNKNRVNSMLMYDSVSVSGELVVSEKILLFYNSNGLQDSTLMYSSKNSGVTWILYMKQSNHYNASKQLTKQEIWGMDEDSGKFGQLMNLAYTYTATGKIKTVSNFLLVEGVEMLWSKTENSYDTSDKLTVSEFSMLNFFTFALEKASRNTYQYNASNDVSVEVKSLWNGATWDEQDKNTYAYTDANLSDVIFPNYTSLFSTIDLFGLNSINVGTSNKAIAVISTSETVNGSWKDKDKTTFYYSGGSSSAIDDIESSLFTFYPNPASNSVSFRWKGNYESLTLEMYQITGAKVMDQITYSNKPVSISKLENGVYFFKLLNGQQMVHTGKLIKR